MLRALDIRDMLIIDRLELCFQPGLKRLDRGKPVRANRFCWIHWVLCLAGVVRAELVRQGAAQGEVVAEFELSADHPPHMRYWPKLACRVAKN